MTLHRRSVELCLLPVLDPRGAAPFYEQLGFVVVAADDEEVVMERPGLQLVLEKTDALEPDDGKPRLTLRVSLDVLDRVWKRDERDEPTLPGPTLSPEGAFDQEVRSKIKNLQEGTASFEIEYQRVMDEIKRKKRLT